MTEPDVVAAIDAAADMLREGDRLPFLHALLRRARDEIVALQKRIAEQDLIVRAAAAERIAFHSSGARAEALEEAAQVCEGSGAIVAEARLCAAAIRALKDKPDG